MGKGAAEEAEGQVKSIDCPSCNGSTCADGVLRDHATLAAADVEACPDCAGAGVIVCAFCDHAAVQNVDGTYLCMAHMPGRLKLRVVP